jgi:hypothetical protein
MFSLLRIHTFPKAKGRRVTDYSFRVLSRTALVRQHTIDSYKDRETQLRQKHQTTSTSQVFPPTSTRAAWSQPLLGPLSVVAKGSKLLGLTLSLLLASISAGLITWSLFGFRVVEVPYTGRMHFTLYSRQHVIKQNLESHDDEDTNRLQYQTFASTITNSLTLIEEACPELTLADDHPATLAVRNSLQKLVNAASLNDISWTLKLINAPGD